MSMGKGSITSMSRRQKLNTRSSTEAELVGVDDAMGLILWTRRFLQAQGYEVKDNLIYQDNQAAMLLETNGKRFSGKGTRHIEIRYFFISDRVSKGEVKIVYCPTDEMVADFFTKPLQGSQFRKHRNAILNCDQLTVDRCLTQVIQGASGLTSNQEPQERVGEKAKRVAWKSPLAVPDWTVVERRRKCRRRKHVTALLNRRK